MSGARKYRNVVKMKSKVSAGSAQASKAGAGNALALKPLGRRVVKVQRRRRKSRMSCVFLPLRRHAGAMQAIGSASSAVVVVTKW